MYEAKFKKNGERFRVRAINLKCAVPDLVLDIYSPKERKWNRLENKYLYDHIRTAEKSKDEIKRQLANWGKKNCMWYFD